MLKRFEGCLCRLAGLVMALKCYPNWEEGGVVHLAQGHFSGLRPLLQAFKQKPRDIYVSGNPVLMELWLDAWGPFLS